MIKRPLIIEFTGTPNSGKTTCIHYVSKQLEKTLGINVKVMKEDAESVPEEIPKKTWARNAWITFVQLQSLLETKYSKTDLILLDRGYCDALFWAKFLETLGSCTPKESDSLLRVLHELNSSFNLLPDYLFIFDVSVEESIKRRTKLGGKITLTNHEFISQYRNELLKFCQSINCKQWYINTTNLTIQQEQYKILKKVAECIQV